jgi:hypothetical protein
MRFAALVLPLLLAGCGGAPGHSGRDYTAPGWQVATVRPNWTLDLEYSFGGGQTVHWDWATDGGRIVNFQLVRIADGGQVTPMVGMQRNESADSRTTPQAGRYDLLWDNQGNTDLVVHFDVPEGAIVRQWPPGQGPGCPPARALLAQPC